MPEEFTHSTSECKKNKGKIRDSRNMPIYFCTCGEAILIVPDVHAMAEAIKAHLTKHKKITGRVLTEDELTGEILKTIGEQNHNKKS
jgi:hypothetical protein